MSNMITRGGRTAPVITEGYVILNDPNDFSLRIKCGRCKMTFYHSQDVEHRYCGNCHAFHADRGSKSLKTE